MDVYRQMAPHELTEIQVKQLRRKILTLLTGMLTVLGRVADACWHAVLEKSQELEDKGIKLVTTELKGKEPAIEYKL